MNPPSKKRKYPTQKRAGEVAQVVKHLPSKYEATPGTNKQLQES
jgi:hypothetical protein